MGTFIRRLIHWLRSSHHDADLREEIETHRVLRQVQLERSGLLPGAAAGASRRALGNTTLAREDVRNGWVLPVLDGVWQDMRAVVRGARKSPGFALIAVATLALGIGANTALFSIYNSLLLRTLPVRDPGSLVRLDNGDWTYPIWEAIDRHSGAVLDSAFAWAPDRFDLSQGGETAFVDGAYVSGRMFDVLGLRPAYGRLLGAADDTRGGAGTVLVISHRFWQQQFGGARDVVGRTLSLQRVAFTVVGVMPEGFFGPDVGRSADVMIPFAAEPLIRANSFLGGHWTWWLQIMARLRPGQTVEQATAALRAIQPQIRAETLPDEGAPAMLARYMVDPLTFSSAATGNSDLRGRFATPLVAMLGVVGLVLLIACANIANLLLARALTRRHELSVRLALGASRWRLARLLLAESLAIAIAGAAAGLVFASWSGALLVRQLSTWRGTISLDLRLDWRVLGFTAALACLTAIVSGVAPAFGVKRVAPNEALKDAGRGIAGDRRFAVRGTLLVIQIALSLVLVIAAGLFLRTFASLSRVPLGFAPDALVVATLNVGSTTMSPAERAELADRMREAAAATPGVTSAALSLLTPLSGQGWNAGVGELGDAPDRTKMTWMNATSPGWFKTMGMRLVGGRDFDASDRSGGEQVAVINEAFARRFLPDRSPVGEVIRTGGPNGRTAYRVVGLVSDAVYRSPREGVVPTVYVPVEQGDGPAATVTIATAPGQRDAVERALAVALKQVDPRVAFTFRTYDEYVGASVLQERIVAWLSTFFGGLGVLLAALGLYGVVSHAVQARRTEIGVRMALGASAAGIVRLVFRRVAVLLVAGLACGATVSLWAARFVQKLLFQLDSRDPVTFAGATLVLAVAVIVAAWLPARRASRLEPARVLREG